MTSTENNFDERKRKRYEKVLQKTQEEYGQELELLRQREDYLGEYAFFLDLFKEPFSISTLAKRVQQPVVGLFCIQAPQELFAAFGLHAVKLCSGSQTVQRVAAAYLPVLMCPMLKAFMGNFELHQDTFSNYKAIIIPTTCDWVVKLPEIMQEKLDNIHYLELPHLRESERSQQRWFEELWALKQYLERITGKRLTQGALKLAVDKYMRAWLALEELVILKRQRRLSALWFTLLTNSFMQVALEEWLEHVQQVIAALKQRVVVQEGKKVFVAGSPIVFPNLKLLELIERAGMCAVADDMCSSERIIPGGIAYNDSSLEGILKAVAERYHKACICPTFADNTRRINNILAVAEEYGIKGVVFNVLKGCHPYDIEAVTIERRLKEQGLKFIKIETDYGREDSQNILTRLEAFKQTL